MYIYIYIWPKIWGIKRFYLYTSKGRQFGRMEETEREDESERYTNIKSNWTMLNESTQNGQSTGKYISDYLWVEWGV